MKKPMRKISFAAMLAGVIFFASCGNGGSATTNSDSSEMQPTDSMTNPTDKSLNYGPQDKAADNPPADSSKMDSSKNDSMK